MGKILKAVGMGVLLIGAGLLTGGAGFLGISAITSGSLIAAGVASTLGGLASLAFAPKMPNSQLSRLNVTLETTTPRKAAFGTTALNNDLRYHEASGTNQEYIDYIIAVAAHKIKSVTEIWFEEKQAWTLGGGVTATYSGYLTVDIRTEGTDANYIAINGGSRWGSASRLTGCAYVHLRVKRTGATSKVESPLVNGLPSRVTIVGEGAYLYDPRLDSTVGGTGSHRANNQATWGAYTDADDCDNPALQLLWWLLGWKINDKLSVGCGIPASRIDMESFITAANICDESVLLATGGTQKRYRTSGTASDSDDRMAIINTFLSCMNGTLRDSSGKLSLSVMKNDLANYVLSFDENDVINDFQWNQTRGLNDSFNKARGRYVDPSNTSLYQLVDYPEVGFASPDGIDRVMTIDLPYVEDGRRAQRIAKQALERNQYRGMFSASFTAKALGCNIGDVVRLSFSSLGWSYKLFRVVSMEISADGVVPMALVEEDPAIYAWDANDAAPVSPTAPTIYNPLNNPFILGTNQAGTTASWSGVVNDNGNKPEDKATRNVAAGTHSTSVAYTKGDFVTNVAGDATYIAKQNVPTGIALTNTVYWDLFVQGTGTPGENAISAFLTNASHVVATATDGSGGSYTNAGGTMRVFDGFTEKTTSGTVTYAKVGTGTWYSINSSGVYTITDPGSDSDTCQFDASYSGVTVRLTYSIAKSKAGATGSNGSPGAAGTPAVSGYLTNEAINLFAYADGSVVSYAPATGFFKIFAGNTDVSSSFSLTTVSNPQDLTIAYTGREYTISGGFDPAEDTATLTIQAVGSGTYSGVTLDKVISLSKTKGGYEIVATLPISNLFTGRVVYLTSDGKLYRYTGSAWTSAVPATDITGTLADAQIAAVAATKVTGQLTDSQLAAIAAAKVTGSLADSQISEIAAVKVTGQIVGTQITDGAISTAKLAAGSVTASTIASDTIVAGNIAAGAITSSELAAGAVVAGKIAAGTIVAGDIAAGTITATQIAAGTITGANIAAGTIAASNIAADTITASQIAANAITASELDTNAVTADKINAGAVTAAKISVTQLDSISATIGTLRTATTGARTEISDNLIKVYDSSNVLRVKIGVW